MSDAARPDQHEEFATAICLERATKGSPFVAGERYVHGYRVDELWQRCSFAEVIYLLFAGELPDARQLCLFECLLVGIANLGPRDVGVRAAMTAGISKTRVEHLLPIGLLCSSGDRNGNSEVVLAHRFLNEHRAADAARLVRERLAGGLAATEVPFAGFGSCYGSPDPLLDRLASACVGFGVTRVGVPSALSFGQRLVEPLRAHGHGWRLPALVAAVSLDLGLGEREAVLLCQIARAPGIAAHGAEQTHRPIQRSRFLGDEHYERRDPS